MKIKEIKLGKIEIPLKKPFKTALRTVNVAEEVVVKIISEDGEIGYGGAPSTAVITGDIEESIVGAVNSIIKPKIIGREFDSLEELMDIINSSIVRNSSAKAAVDIALHDLFCKLYKIPLYKLYGGYRNSVDTDITISLNDPDEMVRDSVSAVQSGFDTLKIKLGSDINMDIIRVKAIKEAVGRETKIRLDANQGWKPKEAVKIIRNLEDMDFNIELVEQPVKASDLEGLKFVTDNVETDILADEAVFGPLEAFKIVEMRAADLINIKLMKCGGLYNAAKICNIAETVGIECMMGCMMESKIGITAATSFAAAKKNISKYDLDTVMLAAKDPVVGGINMKNNKILLEDLPGLGIKDIIGWKEII